MIVKDLREFIFKNYYKQIFTEKNQKKELVLFVTNLLKKIPDLTKAKEHYELFKKKKKEKNLQK